MTIAPPQESPPIVGIDQLLEPFHNGERPSEKWAVGVEVEKFGVCADTFAPMDYAGDRGALGVLGELATRYGWHAKREQADGPIIGLERGAASVSLEPGAQIELGTEPCANVHLLARSLAGGIGEIATVGDAFGLVWLETGFHPFARQQDLPWVPKRRYPIMREYLPQRGEGALDMMRRTATVQASFDYSSERDALRKMTALLRMAPLLNAITANSPFQEGQASSYKSLRGLTWLRMDPSRTGLVPALWSRAPPGYQDYAEWALDAGMFFFVRSDRLVVNAGQTFRDFLQHGYQGHRATMADWKQHLSSLFPEVRLRETLEVRCCDSLPSALTLAVPALLVGILYDEQALGETLELFLPYSLTTVERARPRLARYGLGARFGDVPARALAERLLEIATGGLGRRACLDDQGRDETQYLAGLARFVERGLSPADSLTCDLPLGRHERAREIVKRTRLSWAPRLPPRPGRWSLGHEACSSE